MWRAQSFQGSSGGNQKKSWWKRTQVEGRGMHVLYGSRDREYKEASTWVRNQQQGGKWWQTRLGGQQGSRRHRTSRTSCERFYENYRKPLKCIKEDYKRLNDQMWDQMEKKFKGVNAFPQNPGRRPWWLTIECGSSGEKWTGQGYSRGQIHRA